MDAGLKELVSNPTAKKVLKYGSIAFAVLDVIKQLRELPKELKEDANFAVVVGHFLWHALRFALEAAVLAVVVYVITSLVIEIFTLNSLKVSEHEVFQAIVCVFAIVIGIWIEIDTGLPAVYAGVVHYVRNLWAITRGSAHAPPTN